MKCKETTVALRFADTFAPSEGTIQAHQNMIDKQGFVWYGKLGAAVSSKVANLIMENENPRILLIHSGKAGRYWAYIKKIQYDIPTKSEIPEYYRDNAGISELLLNYISEVRRLNFGILSRAYLEMIC